MTELPEKPANTERTSQTEPVRQPLMRDTVKLSVQRAMGFGILLASVGIFVVWRIFASNAPIAFEAESGNVTSCVTKIANASASQGSAVKLGTCTPAPTPKPVVGALSVRVSGSQLVDASGKVISLAGVDSSGTEDACIKNGSISWGKLDASEVAAMKTWHISSVRVPLNEDCWLGINGLPGLYSAQKYQAGIKSWVANLNGAGIIAILDLQLAQPGNTPSTSHWQMADKDHAPAFWTGVASTFKSNPAVIFDLYNEPSMGSTTPSITNWNCWLKGCNYAAGSSSAATAGIQLLVDTVRATGATQPIMLESLNWDGDPCGLKDSDYKAGDSCVQTRSSIQPVDPQHQLIMSLHAYDWTACRDTTCWGNLFAATKAANIPLVAAELGEGDCSANYVNSFMNWADQSTVKVSYLAWSWEINANSSCSTGNQNSSLQLLKGWDGTPSPIAPAAAAFKAHLVALP